LTVPSAARRSTRLRHGFPGLETCRGSASGIPASVSTTCNSVQNRVICALKPATRFLMSAIFWSACFSIATACCARVSASLFPCSSFWICSSSADVALGNCLTSPSRSPASALIRAFFSGSLAALSRSAHSSRISRCISDRSRSPSSLMLWVRSVLNSSKFDAFRVSVGSV
jgi:hypothetical protein